MPSTERFSRLSFRSSLLLGLVLASGVARAEITVGIDAASLNELLPALAMHEVTVPLGNGQSLRVLLEDLEVTGFDPAAGPEGQILTSVRLRAPQLGLDLVLAPKLSLRVAENGPAREIELTFAEAALPLPLAGTVNIAPLLDPIRFPADGLFHLAGTDGNVEMESKLASIQMGAKVLRFTLDVKAVAPAPPPAP